MRSMFREPNNTGGVDINGATYLRPANDTSASPIVIDDTAWLLSAHFRKAGPDLVLSGEDGKSIVVVDYFRLTTKPALQSGGGATLSPGLVEQLAAPDHPHQFAQAGAPAGAPVIGRVERVGGSATVQHANGAVTELKVGDQILQGDIIQTGDGSLLGLSMTDGTAFNMSASARMVMSELVYSPGSG